MIITEFEQFSMKSQLIIVKNIRFGTLHVFATNLILWLQTLMTDTLEALGEIGEKRVQLDEEVNKTTVVIIDARQLLRVLKKILVHYGFYLIPI